MLVHTPYSILFILAFAFAGCVQSQSPPQISNYSLVGGPCEGCEAVLEYEKEQLNPTDTIPCFTSQSIPIKISGTIYKEDGTVPAPNVILYVYHTNEEGIYEAKDNSEGWGAKHGYLRTWLKTGEDGRYTFYTCKPGAYPGRTNPSHIHAILLEPNGKYYYLSDYVLKGDSLLTDTYISKNPRGGHQPVLDLEREGDLFLAHRDITLGKNVPGY